MKEKELIKEISDRIQAGQTYAQIKKELGLPTRYFDSLIKKHKIRKRKDNLYRDKEWLTKQVNAGRTDDELAEVCNTNRMTILRWRKKFGLRKKGNEPFRNKEVLQWYIDHGYTQQEVADRLHCSKPSIERWEKRFGFSRVRKDCLWRDKEWLHQKIEDERVLPSELAKEINVDPVTIYEWMKIHGIEPRGYIKLKYPCNEDFFKEWSNEMAYVIGWLHTDGSMIKKAYGLQWGLVDREPLEIFQRVFETERPIYFNPRKKPNKNQWRFHINSKKLIEDLHKLEAINNWEDFPLKVPEEYLAHYIRGITEGDGSIWTAKAKDELKSHLRVCIYSSRINFLKNLSKRICFKSYLYHHRKKYWRLLLQRQHAINFCRWLYRDSENLRLERKYKVAKPFL